MIHNSRIHHETRWGVVGHHLLHDCLKPLPNKFTTENILGIQNDKDSSILDYISPDIYTILPNTAGAYSTKDAVRMAKLGREILGGKNLLKLEVAPKLP